LQTEHFKKTSNRHGKCPIFECVITPKLLLLTRLMPQSDRGFLAASTTKKKLPRHSAVSATQRKRNRLLSPPPPGGAASKKGAQKAGKIAASGAREVVLYVRQGPAGVSVLCMIGGLARGRAALWSKAGERHPCNLSGEVTGE
jgi:hypothetical protein